MGIFLFILGGFYGPCDWINDILIPPKKPESIYVATIGGVYQKEKNSFKPINKGFLSLHINSIEIDKEGRVYAGCDDGLYVLKEKEWAKILNEPLISKIFISDKIMIVGTNVGRVLKSNDYGRSWEVVMELPSGITAITSLNKTIYLSSYNSGIYESPDLGTSWKRLKCEDRKILDILVGENGIFVASESGLKRGSGTHWEALNKGLTTKDVRRIIKEKHILYLGSYIGGFFISYDNGKQWQPANTGLYNTNIRDIATSGDTIYLATENGLYKREKKKEKFERIDEGFVYSPFPPPSKTPEEIRKRKEKLGIKPPAEEKAGGH